MSLLSTVELALADGLGLPAAAGAPSLTVFLGYAGAALLCVTAARGLPASASARNGRLPAGPRGIAGDGHWRVAAAALLMLGLDSLLHGDRLFVLWVRDLAGQQGWYEHRRGLQVATLAAGGVLAAASVRPALKQMRAQSLAPSSVCLLASLCGLALLHALRLVSLHYTDLLLDLRLAGASLGRWIEVMALALAAGAALARRRPQPLSPLREFPHV